MLKTLAPWVALATLLALGTWSHREAARRDRSIQTRLEEVTQLAADANRRVDHQMATLDSALEDMATVRRHMGADDPQAIPVTRTRTESGR